MKQRFQQRWHGLTSRERVLIAACGFLLTAGFLFLVIVDPLLERLDYLDRQAKNEPFTN